MTAAASSDSIATVRISLPPAVTSDSSEVQPPITYRTRRLWTGTARRPSAGATSSSRNWSRL